jgi:hypothetical protein
MKYGLIINLGLNIVNIFNDLKRRITRKEQQDKDYSLIEIDFFDDRINDFWNSIKETHDFIVVRNDKYLNWRYCDKRGGNYIIKIAEKDSKILGYIVYRVNRYVEEYPTGNIVDLLALEDRLDVAESLLESAWDHFRMEDVNLALFRMIEGHSYEKIAKRLGFISHPKKILTFIRFFGIREEELKPIHTSNPNRIHLVEGDYDTI